MKRGLYYISTVIVCIVNSFWLLLTLLAGNIIVYETTTSENKSYDFGSLMANCLFHWLIAITLVYSIIKAVRREIMNENKDYKELLYNKVDSMGEKTRKMVSGLRENVKDLEQAMKDKIGNTTSKLNSIKEKVKGIPRRKKAKRNNEASEENIEKEEESEGGG